MANHKERNVPILSNTLSTHTTPGAPHHASEAPGEASLVDELTLAHRAAQGDHRAFATIVGYYEPRLLAFIAQMVDDHECARDLIQETFLAAFRALPRWRPLAGDANEHPLSPWLYRIATNQALTWLRGRSALRRRAAATGANNASDNANNHDRERPLAAQQAGAMSFEDRFAVRDLLEQALRQLSTEDAACLVLHFVAGARYAEIGTRLGLSAEAVRKRVGRGLTALRAAYSALDSERTQTTPTTTPQEATR